MRILMVLVSDTDPDYRKGEQPGPLARLVAPYYLFQDAGIELALASREGGAPWGEPDAPARQPPNAALLRFKSDRSARAELSDTLRFDQIDVLDFDAAFCVGAPNAIWNEADLHSSARIIASFLRQAKPVAVSSGIYDLGPSGAGEGLLIIGESADAPVKAARALLAVLEEAQGIGPGDAGTAA